MRYLHHRGLHGNRGPGGDLLLWLLLLLRDLCAAFHVLRPVGLLADLVAVVGIPAAVVLCLLPAVATLYSERLRGRERNCMKQNHAFKALDCRFRILLLTAGL